MSNHKHIEHFDEHLGIEFKSGRTGPDHYRCPVDVREQGSGLGYTILYVVPLTLGGDPAPGDFGLEALVEAKAEAIASALTKAMQDPEWRSKYVDVLTSLTAKQVGQLDVDWFDRLLDRRLPTASDSVG
jgi:hypothetical protein